MRDYFRKPNPAHLIDEFDYKKIEDYIIKILEVVKDCTLEIILKDTHTCENHPERFDMWTEMLMT